MLRHEHDTEVASKRCLGCCDRRQLVRQRNLAKPGVSAILRNSLMELPIQGVTDDSTTDGSQLADFLDEFDDCFARSVPRGHLASYVRGQLADLPSKSVQPIADFSGTPRRTLQEFLSWSDWDHALMRDRVQIIMARDRADPRAIGILDDSGHPKSGNKTACVQRQWRGNTGKIDNSVITVQLAYTTYDTWFRTMLDSALFLPEKGWDDPARREEAGIPAELTYRPKWQIALELLDRAVGNNVVFGWLTVNEWYSISGEFLAGLEARHQRHVAEVRKSFRGWLYDP
jgi:SRSO17 transposase